jgi:hypothetical protein
VTATSVDLLLGVVIVLVTASVTWGVNHWRDGSTTLREARTVVATNHTLQATVDAQATCIDGLQDEIRGLQADLAKAIKRIADLERIAGDLETRLHLREGRGR